MERYLLYPYWLKTRNFLTLQKGLLCHFLFVLQKYDSFTPGGFDAYHTYFCSRQCFQSASAIFIEPKHDKYFLNCKKVSRPILWHRH